VEYRFLYGLSDIKAEGKTVQMMKDLALPCPSHILWLNYLYKIGKEYKV